MRIAAWLRNEDNSTDIKRKAFSKIKLPITTKSQGNGGKSRCTKASSAGPGICGKSEKALGKRIGGRGTQLSTDIGTALRALMHFCGREGLAGAAGEKAGGVLDGFGGSGKLIDG